MKWWTECGIWLLCIPVLHEIKTKTIIKLVHTLLRPRPTRWWIDFIFCTFGFSLISTLCFAIIFIIISFTLIRFSFFSRDSLRHFVLFLLLLQTIGILFISFRRNSVQTLFVNCFRSVYFACDAIVFLSRTIVLVQNSMSQCFECMCDGVRMCVCHSLSSISFTLIILLYRYVHLESVPTTHTHTHTWTPTNNTKHTTESKQYPTHTVWWWRNRRRQWRRRRRRRSRRNAGEGEWWSIESHITIWCCYHYRYCRRRRRHHQHHRRRAVVDADDDAVYSVVY